MPSPLLDVWAAVLHTLNDHDLLEVGEDGWVRLRTESGVLESADARLSPGEGPVEPENVPVEIVDKSTVPVEKSPVEKRAARGRGLIGGGIDSPSYDGEQSLLPMTPTSTDASCIVPFQGTTHNGESRAFRRSTDPQSNPELLRRFVGFLVGLFVENQPIRPATKDIQKQAAKFRQIARDYSPHEIAEAFRGMGHTWPFSEGRPWDAFDLEKNFNKARQNAATVAEPINTEEGWDEWLA